MADKSGSSKRWLDRQHRDSYVKDAKSAGYRSRAAFKLLELQTKYKLISPGNLVIDLGAAPGSWSQVASKLVGDKGKVIAIDLLPIEPWPLVDIIQGDILDDATYHELVLKMTNLKADVIISDIAPNFSGVRTSDQANAIYLSEMALDFTTSLLKEGGSFVVKVFQGEGFEEYVKKIREQFAKVVIKKPNSSRSESREVYIIAKQRLIL